MPARESEIPRPCVVDTNVAVVANGHSDQASPNLVQRCILALLEVTQKGGLVLDDGDRIVGEYRANLSQSGQPGTGDMFMKWVHDNRFNDSLCELRAIHCLEEPTQRFQEFPATPAALASLDISDRKFVAVANAQSPRRPILQAVDYKWWGWKDDLALAGISVVFLDATHAEARYHAKHATQ